MAEWLLRVARTHGPSGHPGSIPGPGVHQEQKIYITIFHDFKMEKDIGKINKGEYQGTVTDIVVGVREYNGKVGIDIREFVTGERYTGPTKKGLRIPAEHFAAFKEMINSISEEDLAETEKTTQEEVPKEQKTLEKTEEDMPDY